ncbi:MAG TPA: hypothetical protein VMS73_08780 [Anaerolineaceae bacterium]|nr:hypothetical protein [Anaerolineaceae bacterium]
MSRVINPEGAGKERTRLCKSVVLALRELMRQTDANEASQDLAAYISLALQEIFSTVESSVDAWEKKGYWVKADRFRMEWEWTDRLGKKMNQALLAGDWATVAMTAAQVGQKMVKVDVPIRHKLGTPWEGAWRKMTRSN